MPRLGVEHVLDVTALDRLGLPVFMSVRPRVRAVQLHSGKGLTADDAHAGALMEALEYAASERACAAGADERLALHRLLAQWPDDLGVADFAPRLGAALPRNARVAAVACEQLPTRRRLLLPAELVLLPMPPRSGPVIFGTSSNGLASGNTLGEATLHALLEVLERDTLALHIGRDESCRLVASTLPDPFLNMARAWRRDGVHLHVRYLPNELGLPCFEAGLHEAAAGHASLVLLRGWGLHFDRHIALSRAICEAAQARLAAILATRADLPGSAAAARRIGAPPSEERTSALLERLARAGRRVHFDTVPHDAAPTVAAALRMLLSRLPAVGLGPVFRRRLHLDGGAGAMRGLHVVKVVVARSETPVGQQARLGPRMLARLQGA